MIEIIENKVQEHRLKKNITQEEFARSVGVTRQTVIAIEKGNYAPSVLLALKISKFFRVAVEEIFTIKKR